MSLSFKEKELVNVGASVAAGCKPCTSYHFKKVRAAGATDCEIQQAISDAVNVRNSALEIMANHGLGLVAKSTKSSEVDSTVAPTRIKALVSIAAAFAVNCTTNLEKHIALARNVGITDAEVMSVLDAASFIKGRAASYAQRIVKLKERNTELQRLLKELEETQAQLVQSEKVAALGKLVAGMLHEMNTPLGALKSTMDVINRCVHQVTDTIENGKTLDELKGSKRLRRSVTAFTNSHQVGSAAVDRLNKILSSLKSFSRRDEAEYQEADLNEGIENTLTLLDYRFENRIEIKKELGALPRIPCFIAELNQVFMHLLTNAVESIRGPGAITIRTSVQAGNVCIEISDTGVGISPKQKERLFEPDFTQKGSRVKAGIGLFTSYNIVRKHQGEIRVDSEVGKGSSFSIVLPVR
jgi:AhpD family alkylhydroperoxidase